MSNLESGSVVWVRLGQAWWPGTVTTLEKCPPEFVKGLRKTPVAVVKFFHENEFQDVRKTEHIYPYFCERKEEFIRRGLYMYKNQSHGDVDLLRKFESDVVTAEKLTGGDMDILQTIGEVAGKRRVDYSDLGFGLPKAKKKKDEGSKRGSDIGQAVVYKKSGPKGNGRVHGVLIEHKVRILEQPKRETIEESLGACNWFKCYVCGFTCTRLNVIIWHNKAHLKKVYNFDTGIKIPGRRRRKGPSKANKDGKKRGGRTPKGKGDADHALTNGEVAGGAKGGHDTQQLLQDWDDEEDAEVVNGERRDTARMEVPSKAPPVMNADNSDDDYSDDGNYPPPQPNHERRPMPKAADINSAFDALLATTPSNVTATYTSQTSNYVNNDSDSDCSDWEKYYDRGSGSDRDEDDDEETPVSDIKSICEESSEKSDSLTMEQDNKMNIESNKKDDKDDSWLNKTPPDDERYGEVKMEPSEMSIREEESTTVKSEIKVDTASIHCLSEENSHFTEKSHKKLIIDSAGSSKDVSQKSSTDIYEYVDEFCESGREPYEPPKKPYESLQKYRLLQEARRSPPEASRSSLYEDGESSRESYGTKDDAYEYGHEGKESQRSCMDVKPQKDSLDYKSEDDAESEGRKSPLRQSDYKSDEEDSAEWDKSKESKDLKLPNAEDPHELEPSDVHEAHDSAMRKTQDYGSNVELHQKDGLKDLNRPHGSYEDENSEGQEQHNLESHEPHASEVQVEQSDSVEVQEEYLSQDAYVPVTSGPADSEASLDRGTSVSTFIAEEISSEEPAYHVAVESSREEDSDERLSSHAEANRDCSEPTKQSPESSQDIIDFTKDLDRLTQNIDRLTQNIDPRSAEGDGVEEGPRKTSEGEESEASPCGEDAEALNLTTQDRNVSEISEEAGACGSKSSHDQSGSQSRGGSSHEKLHPPKPGDHSVSSGSGTTYMLVAVDAHGNTIQTVPTSTLKDGSNLMAMEATLEDGTTRTLYVDPTQLGPDVDLNNLILQEQVI